MCPEVQTGTKRRLSGAKKRTLLAAATYVDNNARYMRYNDYLANGFPIASGPVEGTCKNLIKDRMERSGMRWTPDVAEAIVKLRSLHLWWRLRRLLALSSHPRPATLSPATSRVRRPKIDTPRQWSQIQRPQDRRGQSLSSQNARKESASAVNRPKVKGAVQFSNRRQGNRYTFAGCRLNYWQWS